MNTAQVLPVGKRLTFRILITTLLGLAFTLMAIGYTLLLSWQLEGGAAAINEAGSLRVRSYRLAVVMERVISTSAEDELVQFSDTLNNLQMGDAKRPLFLPTTKPIREQMLAVQKDWTHSMQVLAKKTLQETEPARKNQALQLYIEALPAFVENINQLVSLVEVELSEKTT